MILQYFPIILTLLALLIPIVYCLVWKNEGLKKASLIFISGVLIVIFYPIISILGNYIDYSFSYFIGKIILFVIIPLIIIIYIEKWKLKEAFSKIGVNNKNLFKSTILGLGVLIITLFIYIWGVTENAISYHNILMFLDAFNEEFYFRGVLLLYIWKITNIKVAYLTSVLAFVLAHPQHFLSLTTSSLLIGTIMQAILLAIVTYKTQNIIGPWISHGLNRILPQLLKLLILTNILI